MADDLPPACCWPLLCGKRLLYDWWLLILLYYYYCDNKMSLLLLFFSSIAQHILYNQVSASEQIYFELQSCWKSVSLSDHQPLYPSPRPLHSLHHSVKMPVESKLSQSRYSCLARCCKCRVQCQPTIFYLFLRHIPKPFTWWLDFSLNISKR